MAKEVTITTNEKNIPIWKNEDGSLVQGLEKKMFLNENVAQEDKNEAKKAFYMYMKEYKLAKATVAQARVDSYKEAAEEYQQKHDEVGKELTEEQKAVNKLSKLEKQIQAAKAALAALQG